MDNPQLKERNYRIVNKLRLRNQRETRLLHERLYSKQGLESSYLHEMNAVSMEQERIRKEMARIRQTITTTWGTLPARDPSRGQADTSRASHQMNMAYILYGSRGNEKKSKRKKRKNHSFEKMQAVPHTESNETTENDDTKQDEKKENGHEKQDTGVGLLTRTKLPLLHKDSAAEGCGEQENVDNINANESSSVHLATLLENETESPRIDFNANDTDVLKIDVEAAKGNVMTRLAGGQDQTSKGASSPTKKKLMRKLSRPTIRPNLTPIEEQGQDDTRVPGDRRPAATRINDRADDASNSRKSREPNQPQFDRSLYNPDGSVRTVHNMENMEQRLNEAKNARYIRHKELLERERELSINEILGRDNSSENQMHSPLKT